MSPVAIPSVEQRVYNAVPKFVYVLNRTIVAMRAFNVFTKDNDPYGEHDCASF
jgi:hypothetical protein